MQDTAKRVKSISMDSFRVKALHLAAVWALLGSLPLAAQWQLIEDWESFEPGTYTAADGNLPYPIASNGDMGQVDIFEGIPGANGKAAWLWYGMAFTSAGGLWHQIPLAFPVLQNTSATVTFRIWQESYNLEWHVMVSKVEAGKEPDNTSLWGNQSAIMRYNTAQPLKVDIRDGGSYEPSNPPFLPELEQWYQYWMVLDNFYDAQGNQAGFGGYEVYVQGPEDDQPRLLTWGEGIRRARLEFRNQSQASLKTLVLCQTSQHPANIWLIDDIYMAPGVNLPIERPAQWCGLPKAGSDVDTGTWLGWLHVGEVTDPGWGYCYLLERYLYIPACPQPEGGWVWVSGAPSG